MTAQPQRLHSAHPSPDSPEPHLVTDEMVLNMGPQHPSTHGILRLILKLDGEVVRDVQAEIGYLHRCKEKIGENLQYNQYTTYSDRMDYLAGMNNNVGHAIAVERLMGNIQVPERAEYIRVIMAELNRIASHLVALGTYGVDIGAVTPFLYAFRDREKILDLFEEVSGARLLYNYVRIGGVVRDLPEGWGDRCRKFLDYLAPRLDEFDTVLSLNPIFIDRTAKVGVLPADVAINYGCTGPMLRGSGVKRDLRKDEPYSVYSRFSFETPVGPGPRGVVGDCLARYWVRIREMRESAKIVRQALDQLPSGPVMAKLPRILRVPPGEVYVRTENPRGELGFYIISDGSPKPYRFKVRSPAYCNLSVIGEISRGALVADMVAILGSIDIVLGEVDR
ncbi:MAG: NADH-quinone oxidoreductase subunit D [Elusimicrobia bacterium]|nr:NADH-quinone oxidoreductase subunit D [Elusimicrobiota bacterium]